MARNRRASRGPRAGPDGGLYRRDPAAQRNAARLRAWGSRTWRGLLGQPPRTQHLAGGVSSTLSSTASVEAIVRPGARPPDAKTATRLDWLENASDVAFRELDREQATRRKADDDLRQRVAAVEELCRGETDTLRRLLDEVGVPERLEWWGAGLVGVSLLLGALDAVIG